VPCGVVWWTDPVDNEDSLGMLERLPAISAVSRQVQDNQHNHACGSPRGDGDIGE
jgi:hypothetical protein